MTTFTSVLIALFISLGIINTSADLDNLTEEQQAQIEIVITDDLGS